MDDLARFNQQRWDALVKANVAYSRPLLDLDAASARRLVDPFDVMGDVAGKNVLCLASGGGQQSAAFGLLGAQVTVLDFSAAQLARDRQALDHYGLAAALMQGDMRDLSAFADDAFDLVWQAYSINFVPAAAPVFDEVRRVLRGGGQYRLEWANPFQMGADETSWTGQGYVLSRVYGDGEVHFDDQDWEVWAEDGTCQQVAGPREFNHSLSTVINGLLARDFRLLGLWEEASGDPEADPGSWAHYKAVAPPYLTIWARLAPA